jgi:hypothetical protein
MRRIEKPEITARTVDKKSLWFNIRESRLMYMMHRNLITYSEYEAGSRYRRMCEIATLGSGSSIKETRIDGSRPDIIVAKLGAIFELVRVSDEIGSDLTQVMKLFCWQNYGIIEIASQLNLSERKASNKVHDGLRALSIYYGYEKVRNTIRGQGTKIKRPKVS